MEDSTIIFGIRAILEAIKAGKEIEKLYLLQDLKGDLAKELKKTIADQNLAKSYVPIEKLNKLAKNQNHQGAVAKISVVKTIELHEVIEKLLKKDSPALVLLLDQITDVRNFGAILRTAECTGVDAVVFPKQGNAPINAGSDVTICDGDATTLTATGGVVYTWDQGLGAGNNFNVTPSITTTYTVNGTDANGCSGTDQPGEVITLTWISP